MRAEMYFGAIVLEPAHQENAQADDPAVDERTSSAVLDVVKEKVFRALLVIDYNRDGETLPSRPEEVGRTTAVAYHIPLRGFHLIATWL